MEVSTASKCAGVIYLTGTSVSEMPNRLAIWIVLAGIDVDVKLRLRGR